MYNKRRFSVLSIPIYPLCVYREKLFFCNEVDVFLLLLIMGAPGQMDKSCMRSTATLHMSRMLDQLKFPPGAECCWRRDIHHSRVPYAGGDSLCCCCIHVSHWKVLRATRILHYASAFHVWYIHFYNVYNFKCAVRRDWVYKYWQSFIHLIQGRDVFPMSASLLLSPKHTHRAERERTFGRKKNILTLTINLCQHICPFKYEEQNCTWWDVSYILVNVSRHRRPRIFRDFSTKRNNEHWNV